MAVRFLGEHDIALYRSLRLRALAADPEAFGSDHTYESTFDDDTWRARLLTFAGRPGVVMVDEIDGVGDATGMVGVGGSGESDEAIIWGMWVEPAHRRRGVARRLLAAGLGWARDQGYRAAVLNVTEGNDPAHLLYLAAGFVEIGRNDHRELVLRLEL